MKKKAALFIESNTTGTGKYIANLAEKYGLHAVFLVNDPKKYDFLGEFDYRIVDTSQYDDLVLCIEDLLIQAVSVNMIMSTSEYYVEMAAKLAKHYHLPGPDPHKISVARNKGAVREHLQSIGLSRVDYQVVFTMNEAKSAYHRIGGDVVAKPNTGSGSCAVRLCQSIDDIEIAFKTAEAECKSKGKSFAEIGLLLDNYLSGKEYSVEIFDGNVIGITKKYTSDLPYFVERGHDYPADLSEHTVSLIENYSLKVVQALELTWGCVHMEVKLVNDAVELIEVNPRLAGGMIWKLMELATGINLPDAILRKSLGQQVSIEHTKNRYAAIRFLIPSSVGGMLPKGKTYNLPINGDIDELRIYTNASQPATLKGDFSDRIGHIITVSDTARDVCNLVNHYIAILEESIVYA